MLGKKKKKVAKDSPSSAAGHHRKQDIEKKTTHQGTAKEGESPAILTEGKNAGPQQSGSDRI